MNTLQASLHPVVRLVVARSGRWPMGLQRGWLLLGLLACLPGAALAASSASCSVDTSSAQIAFGTYDPLALTPLDGVGTLAVSCDKNNIPVAFSLDRGSSSTFQPRGMRSGANVLPYNLYIGSPNSGIVFGDGSGGTQIQGAITQQVGLGTFVAKAQLFGRIQPGENAAFGSYSDTIRVQVTF